MSKITKILLFPAIFFFLIFQFYIPVILNSAFFITLVCLLFIRDKGLKALHDIILERKFVFISVLFFLPFIYAVFYNVFIFSSFNDYSYINVAINGYIYILCTAIVSSLIIQEGVNKRQLNNYLLWALLMQSFIIVGALSSNFIFDFVRSFQSTEQAMRDFRALTLSGPLYFALAIMMVFYLFFYFCFSLKKHQSSYSYFIVGVLCIPFFTIGRVIFILPIFCLIYGLVKYKYKLFKILCISFLIAFILLLCVYALSEIGVIKLNFFGVIEPIYNWVFEIIINYNHTGEFTSESTDMLEGMYFPIEQSTLFFGDGQYTGIDGRYYMHTDAGYMRNILLFGVFVSMFFVVIDLVLLKSVSTHYFKGVDGRLFFWLSLLLLSILHYKGEVFGYSFPLHIVMFILYFSKGIED